MAHLALSGITKKFGRHTPLAGLDLEIADGEFFVLLGPTGAGNRPLYDTADGAVANKSDLSPGDGAIINMSDFSFHALSAGGHSFRIRQVSGSFFWYTLVVYRF